MSITLLIFFLIYFRFMQKNGLQEVLYTLLSSNCTTLWNIFPFYVPSLTTTDFSPTIRFLFLLDKLLLSQLKTDLYCKKIRHRFHFKYSSAGLRKTFRNRKSQPASAIGTALIPSCKTCGKIHILF